MDLTRAFLNSNIALHKITNASIVQFIEKYTKFAAPTERTLRRNYVPALYDECINRMKEIAAGQKIWVSIDETTDCEQRYIANFVFGVLGQPDRCYLFAIKQLEATNSSTVATFFDESVSALGVPRTDVLLAATDAAPYMVCAMDGLKLLYPNMVHVTCLGHGLHRVADFTSEQFKDVNDLVSNIKKIFRKVNSLNSNRSFFSESTSIDLNSQIVFHNFSHRLHDAKHSSKPCSLILLYHRNQYTQDGVLGLKQ